MNIIERDGETRYIVRKHGIIRCDFQKDTGVLFLSNLTVDYNHCRQHIATKLMSDAVELGKAMGCDSLSLEVDMNNQWLRKWYERLGFNIVGYGYSDERLLMNKTL